MLGELPLHIKHPQNLSYPQQKHPYTNACGVMQKWYHDMQTDKYLPCFLTKVDKLCLKQPENTAMPTIMAMMGHTLMTKLHEMINIFNIKYLAMPKLCCAF